MQAVKNIVTPVPTTKRVAGRDIVLNVNFKQSLIRFGVMIMLPLVMLLIGKHLIIYTAPVLAYLFITAITHFCIIKYVWQRVIKHEPAADLPKYGQDPNYLEESF